MPKRSDEVTFDNSFDSLLPRAKRVPDGDKQLTAIIPERVFNQLRARSAADGEPLRVVVLKALKEAGYDVTPDDLIDRRVPAGRARSEAIFRDKTRRKVK